MTPKFSSVSLANAKRKITQISISAKCSDCFSASAHDKHDRQVGKDYDGYVPGFFPRQHYGDYVMLDIDVETGRILNWKAPSQDELLEVFWPLADGK